MLGAINGTACNVIALDGPGGVPAPVPPPFASYRAGRPSVLTPAPSPTFGGGVDRNLTAIIPWPSHSS